MKQLHISETYLQYITSYTAVLKIIHALPLFINVIKIDCENSSALFHFNNNNKILPFIGQ